MCPHWMRQSLSPCAYVAKHMAHSVSSPSKMAMSSARRGVTGTLTVEGAGETPVIDGSPALSSVSLTGKSWNWSAAAAAVSATVPKKFDLTWATQSLNGGREDCILVWLYVLIKSTVLCCVVERVGGACVSRAAAGIGEGDRAR